MRWIATLACTGLAVIGVDCNRHLPHSVSGSRLRRHPAATMQPVQRPFRQAVDATDAALLGAGFAVLLAITT